MWTIAKLAFKEIMYKKIFFITLLMSLAFLVFYGIANYFAVREMSESMGRNAFANPSMALQQNFLATQFLDVGLYLASLITGLLTILSSVGSIAGEIENHQIDTILARPLPRRSVVLGKFLGLGGLLVIYSAIMFLGVILINQVIGGDVFGADLTGGRIMKALMLFILQPILLVAVALLFSSIVTTINGGVILIIMYGISFIGGFIEQFGVVLQNTSLVNIGIISSLIFPFDSLFRKMNIALFDTADDPLSFAAQGIFGSISAPSNVMILYTVLYGVTALYLAIRKFNMRDL